MQLAKTKPDLQLLGSGLLKVVRCTLCNINGNGKTVYTTKLMIELATILHGCHRSHSLFTSLLLLVHFIFACAPILHQLIVDSESQQQAFTGAYDKAYLQAICMQVELL